ncbi:MAG: hypothetical protein IJF18_05720 [Oscillospiraceae bacterium]|nr:hypothetical protein [Oscillospiraceae bacterium]
MKKELLSTMLIAAMLLSMTACGTSTDTPETTKGTEVTTAAAEEEKTEAETEAPAETEETTTTTEAPKEVQKITSKPTIYNDCMTFEQDGTTYLYNIADNKMYSIDGQVTEKGAIGKIVATFSYDGFTGLYNLETNELYDVEICNTPSLSEYNLVRKWENSFDGSTYNYGVIDKNGEWLMPLASDYAILEYPIEYASIVSSDLAGYDVLIYDWKNDSVEIFDGGNGVLDINGHLVLTYKSAYDDSSVDIYDTNTKELTNVYTGPLGSWRETGNGLFAITGSSFYDDKYFAILDDNYSILYSNTEYFVEQVYDASEKYVVFQARNDASVNYIVMLDSDGNRIIEPIEGYAESAYVYNDYIISIDPDNNRDAEFILNCTTGEMIDYNYDLRGFCSDAGKIIVESEGAYYLVDPADPETLINPFEIAE